jgi:hypothetical protein
LELLKDTVPTPSRVAVIFSANNPNTAGELAETTEAAQIMGVQLQPLMGFTLIS